MEEVKLKALGMEGIGLEPSTVEEFDQIAKKVGTCLQRAREYVRFHVTLGEVRELFLHGQEAVPAADGKPAVEAVSGVEATSGIARKTKPVLKDGKPVVKDGETVTDYDETEGDYFKRVVATLVSTGKFSTEEDAKASFQPLFDQVLKVVGFPVEARERKISGPGKLPAKYKLAAAKVIVLNTIDNVNANLLSKVNKSFAATGDMSKTYTGTFPNKEGVEQPFTVSDKDAETLGRFIKEYSEWKAAQTLAEVV